MTQISASRWHCIEACKHVRGILYSALSGTFAVLSVCRCERPVVEVMLPCSLWCHQVHAPICRILIGSCSIYRSLMLA